MRLILEVNSIEQLQFLKFAGLSCYKRKISFIFLIALVVGFALIFLPRAPRPLVVKVEFEDELRSEVKVLDVGIFQEGREIKSKIKYYRTQRAPEYEKVEAYLMNRPVEIEISVFGDMEQKKMIFHKKYKVEPEWGEELTFYVKYH